MTERINRISGWFRRKSPAGRAPQYYATLNGQNVNIQNQGNILAGVWYDDTNPIHDNVTGLELAQEAQRAVAHFGITDLHNSQFVIAPRRYPVQSLWSNDSALGAGYCAGAGDDLPTG